MARVVQFQHDVVVNECRFGYVELRAPTRGGIIAQMMDGGFKTLQHQQRLRYNVDHPCGGDDRRRYIGRSLGQHRGGQQRLDFVERWRCQNAGSNSTRRSKVKLAGFAAINVDVPRRIKR